jgi:hypothetical protein
VPISHLLPVRDGGMPTIRNLFQHSNLMHLSLSDYIYHGSSEERKERSAEERSTSSQEAKKKSSSGAPFEEKRTFACRKH